MTEAEFQAAVCQLAELLGWRWSFTRPTRGKGGRWTTANTRPMPDLELWHPTRGGYLRRELKVPRGAGGRILPSQWRPGQHEVLVELMAAGVDAAVWTPADLDAGRVQRELSPWIERAAS